MFNLESRPQYDLTDSFTITSQEVFDILNGLDISKASGPDLVNPRLLKEGASCLSAPLSKFFNHILCIGKFPQLWKEANATPVFKKGDRHIPNNYRPISLISCIGKVMERVIHKYAYNYCLDHSIFTFQSGFIQGDSTTYQLLDLYHDFL